MIIMGKAKTLLTGFIFGGVVSAASVLLTTPKSGKELIAETKVKSDDIKEGFAKLKSDLNELSTQVKQLSSEGKEVIQEVAADLKRSISSYQQDIQPNLARLKEDVEEMQKTIETVKDEVNSPASK
jgi:gas vesicle protein